MASDRWFTVPECARRLHVGDETIRRHIRSGLLPSSRDELSPGRPFRVKEVDLIAFRERRTNPYTPKTGAAE